MNMNLLILGKVFIPGKNYIKEETIITTITKPYADISSVTIMWIMLFLTLSATIVIIKCFPPTCPKEFYPDETTYKELNQPIKNKLIKYISILTLLAGIALTIYMMNYKETETVIRNLGIPDL